MKKIFNFVKNLLIIIYILLIIFVTICLLSYNDYKLAVLNEVLCNVEYQEDGSTATMWKQYIKNPKGFAFWRKICIQYPMSKKRLWIDCVHYVSESIIAGNKRYIKESPRRIMTIITVPFGILLSIYTKIKAKNT